MMPAFKLYLMEYTGENAADIEMSRDEWKDLIVQEAVLNTMRLTTVLPQYEKNLNRAYGPLYKELTITSLRKPILWLIDETQLCHNKGPHPTRKDTAVISLSAIGQETRTRALLECERRFCTNRTEELNGSAVVKSSHELLCIGLDLRLCSCTHLKKQEALLVQDAVCDGFVKYGMKVFEYEHTEKQRIRQEQADEVAVGQAEGGSRKKSRTHTADPMMTFGQTCPWEDDDDYGFGDNEVQEVGCPVESVEDKVVCFIAT